MSQSKKKGTRPMVPSPPKDLKTLETKRNSDRIYSFIMRGGGEPFGRPLGLGISTLTEKIVRMFKQRSFFGFETLETHKGQKERNKFTRHGAARFRGELKGKGQKPRS